VVGASDMSTGVVVGSAVIPVCAARSSPSRGLSQHLASPRANSSWVSRRAAEGPRRGHASVLVRIAAGRLRMGPAELVAGVSLWAPGCGLMASDGSHDILRIKATAKAGP